MANANDLASLVKDLVWRIPSNLRQPTKHRVETILLMVNDKKDQHSLINSIHDLRRYMLHKKYSISEMDIAHCIIMGHAIYIDLVRAAKFCMNSKMKSSIISCSSDIIKTLPDCLSSWKTEWIEEILESSYFIGLELPDVIISDV